MSTQIGQAPSRSERGGNLRNIQFLRFVAAALVVMSHAGLAIYGIAPATTNLGGVGVDIFFVISGFIMPYMTYGGSPGIPAVPKFDGIQFLLKRLTRIWPLYAIATLTMVALAALLTTGLFPMDQYVAYHFGAHKIDLGWILQSLTFTHLTGGPIIPLGWTLQAEFIFYVFFAVVLIAKPPRTSLYPALYFVVFGILGAIPFLFQSPESFVGKIFTVVGSPMMLEFFFGMLLYEAYSRNLRTSVHLSIILGLIGVGIFYLAAFTSVISFVPSTFYRPLTWGIAAMLLVWAALSMEGKVSVGHISELGDSSYSLYLVHGLLTPFITGAWNGIGGQNYVPWFLYLLGTLAISQFVALWVYKYIEHPIHEQTKRKIDTGWHAGLGRIGTSRAR
ncbi:acyltransferase family protein [Mesorhizobium sp. NPDC059054]|uniref:acyltransferase family protein n=1 Tax=Mesorhizobium sp. NPDC059054 TaxID=3346711 RepID=UPI0036C41F69